jgi:Right handed beta helix region
VACAAAALALASPANASYGCVRWAAAAGSDTNPGTRAAPYHSILRLLSALQPGQTGCLEPGTTFHENIFVGHGGRPGAPVRLITPGSPRAIVNGVIRVAPEAHDLILARLVVQGNGSVVDGIVSVHASRVKLIRVEVAGPGYLNRRVACVKISGGARDVLLQHDVIHDCSRTTTRRADATGIAISNARATRILDNYVFHAPGDGIALAPDADATLVAHNVVDGNVSAIFLGGGARRTSSGNRIVDNILSFSGKWNVHSFWLGPRGRGNVVARNCIWRGFRRNLAGDGYRAYRNLVTAPRYKNRPASLTLRRGACFGKRPRPYQFDTTDYGLPFPKLRRFLVHWTVRALPTRVQIVSISFGRLHPRAQVELRCRRGCSVRETVFVGPGGSASSVRLLGKWLPRGSVIEVRERRAGSVGAYASIRVLGLPRGVAIGHACLSPLEQQTPVSCSRYP